MTAIGQVLISQNVARLDSLKRGFAEELWIELCPSIRCNRRDRLYKHQLQSPIYLPYSCQLCIISSKNSVCLWAAKSSGMLRRLASKPATSQTLHSHTIGMPTFSLVSRNPRAYDWRVSSIATTMAHLIGQTGLIVTATRSTLTMSLLTGAGTTIRELATSI
jgi:hypothetical protein